MWNRASVVEMTLSLRVDDGAIGGEDDELGVMVLMESRDRTVAMESLRANDMSMLEWRIDGFEVMLMLPLGCGDRAEEEEEGAAAVEEGAKAKLPTS